MKSVLPFVVALVGLVAGCWRGGVSTSVTTTSDEHGTRVEATLRGEGSSVTVSGAKIELASGTVRVDGVSYGSVPAGAEVRYVLADGARTLTVDGVTRSPVP